MTAAMSDPMKGQDLYAHARTCACPECADAAADDTLGFGEMLLQVDEQPVRPFDLVGAIMDFESGTLSNRGILNLFAHLIRTGTAWTLQGSYGRAAASLIERGLISPAGVVDWEAAADIGD